MYTHFDFSKLRCIALLISVRLHRDTNNVHSIKLQKARLERNKMEVRILTKYRIGKYRPENLV